MVGINVGEITQVIASMILEILIRRASSTK